MLVSELNALYKKVEKGVKTAQKQLIAEHKKQYPNHELNKTRPTDIGCQYQQNLAIIHIRLSTLFNEQSK